MKKNIPFNSIAEYYDLIYQNKNYLEEANYISKLLEKFSSSEKNLLELGCGTGRHGLLLQEQGFNIEGIDRSSSMIKIAKENGYKNCSVSNIEDFNLTKPVDKIIALFHVMSYVTENIQINKILSSINNNLKSGGIFLFDIWFTHAVLTQRPEIKIKRVSNDVVEIVRIAEPYKYELDNLVDVNYTYYVKNKIDKTINCLKESHLMRHFSIPELNEFALKNGFKLLHTEEWMTSLKPSSSSWGITVIFKKL